MIQRFQFSQIQVTLFRGKVVIIYGARQVEKTSISKQILNTYSQKGLKTKYFNCELSENQEILHTRSLAKLKALIGIYDLVVLDEAQKIPGIGEVLKIMVDNLPKTQIIATRSSSFELAHQTGESLVGRARTVRMYPLSTLEIVNQYDLNYLRENIYLFIQYGMLPGIFQTENFSEKLDELEQITEAYLYKDLLKLDEVRKPDMLEKLVKILAHQVGSEVSLASIASTLQISPLTVEKYIDILQKAFVIYKLSPFSGNLQSEVKNKPKYYFYDTGVLNVLLDRHHATQLDQYSGKVWENFVVMEKIKQNELQKLLQSFYFWRNKGGAEVDLVIKTTQGLETFEIKYGTTKKARLPQSFQEAYRPISFQTVTPENFWGMSLG